MQWQVCLVILYYFSSDFCRMKSKFSGPRAEKSLLFCPRTGKLTFHRAKIRRKVKEEAAAAAVVLNYI